MLFFPMVINTHLLNSVLRVLYSSFALCHSTMKAREIKQSNSTSSQDIAWLKLQLMNKIVVSIWIDFFVDKTQSA